MAPFPRTVVALAAGFTLAPLGTEFFAVGVRLAVRRGGVRGEQEERGDEEKPGGGTSER